MLHTFGRYVNRSHRMRRVGEHCAPEGASALSKRRAEHAKGPIVHKTTQAIVLLVLCYLAFFLYAFGNFLQIPVIDGSPLTFQAALEPVAFIALMAIGNAWVAKVIYERKKQEQRLLDEKKLLLPTLALLLLIAFGAGLHSAGQLIADMFDITGTSVSREGESIYHTLHFLEEYLGHFLIFPPYIVLLFFIVTLEINRAASHLSRFDKGLILISGLLIGTLFGLGNAEAGSAAILIIPMNFLLLFHFYSLKQRRPFHLLELPFASCWFIATVTMTFTGIFFGFKNGWFTQPTAVGLRTYLGIGI